MSEGNGSGFPARLLPVIWSVIWPVLVYDVIRELIAIGAGAILGEMGTLCAAALAASAVLFPVYKRGQSWGREKERAGRYLLILLLSSACGIALNVLILGSGIGTYFPAYQETGRFLSEGPLWLQLLLMGAAVPLAEEIIFRGIGYEALRRTLGFWAAAALSAFIFGLSHGNLVQGIYGTILGFFLACIYEYAGGLSGAVLFHAGANVAAVLLAAI